MDREQLKSNLRDMACMAPSTTANAALVRINQLEVVLHKLAYWFDADQEILESMTPDERADHVKQHKMILDALHN
ncbi:MAG: hypothetical protein GY820_32060 [Gammaproteobacteria bacterium]|nr:hypothetical protein [Gammaproteobacteria bacterium]